MKNIITHVICYVISSMPLIGLSSAQATTIDLGGAEIYYGDYNSDGIVDFNIIEKKIIPVVLDDIFIPIVIDKPLLISSYKSSSSIDYILIPDPGEVNFDQGTKGVYSVVTGDFNGDGLQDSLMLASIEGQENIVMLAADFEPYLNYVQTLSISNIGYDLGEPDTTVIAQDFNNDGRTDLVIKRDGSYVGVLTANADGTFSRPPSKDEAERMIALVWQGFNLDMADGKFGAALGFIAYKPREKYSEAFNALGSDTASQVLDGIVDFKKISINEGIATYAVTRNIDGQNIINIVTFIRDYKDVWRIEGL